ncbi:HAD family hydrolase [Vallitalea okinawensis]|uniref:HAD family hydrolase n=1 Tax=Vallitalea okinawensis TaxID=2078660 RepID=UPI000CFBC570|nr:HAD family phosphatase [Vallitalea okinawensis]
MLQDIKAVLFDLDGTLVDSMWIWEDIDIRYMEKMNITYNLSDLHENINGMSFTETAVFFKETFNIKDSVEEIKEDWVEMAHDYYASKVPLKENVITLLNALKAKGIKMGIGTSNSRELVTLILETHGITHYFDSVRTSCEVATGKPSPDIYLKVAEDLGVQPKECIVFEDIEEGVTAANRAGMRSCGIYDEYSKDKKTSIIAIADYYIHNYSEVLSSIKDENDEQISANF